MKILIISKKQIALFWSFGQKVGIADTSQNDLTIINIHKEPIVSTVISQLLRLDHNSKPFGKSRNNCWRSGYSIAAASSAPSCFRLPAGTKFTLAVDRRISMTFSLVRSSVT
jgi:hypothetical protein